MTSASLRLLVLKTRNVTAMVAFYELFGLTFTEEQHGRGPRHFSAPLGDGIVEIYPLPDGQLADTTTRLGFAVSDPDAVVNAVGGSEGRVAKPGSETPWGYRALVEDPDGRTIELYRV